LSMAKVSIRSIGESICFGNVSIGNVGQEFYETPGVLHWYRMIN
jgi:hypothetical protein